MQSYCGDMASASSNELTALLATVAAGVVTGSADAESFMLTAGEGVVVAAGAAVFSEVAASLITLDSLSKSITTLLLVDVRILRSSINASPESNFWIVIPEPSKPEILF